MKLTKMHGLGNDFVLVDNMRSELKNEDLGTLARILCNRRTGIGADGLILAEPSEKADVKMRIINSDGSEAEMCGNGIRCFTLFVTKNNLVSPTLKTLSVETLAGIMRPEIKNTPTPNTALVRVNMGKPNFDVQKIPMRHSESTFINRPLDGCTAAAVLMGVPHLVLYTEETLTREKLVTVGSAKQNDPMFPEAINVDFVYRQNGEYHMRTYERGCGVTCACGTGACATAVALSEMGIIPKLGLGDSGLHLNLILGELFIEQDENGDVFMTGPAETVFETEAELNTANIDHAMCEMAKWLE